VAENMALLWFYRRFMDLVSEASKKQPEEHRVSPSYFIQRLIRLLRQTFAACALYKNIHNNYVQIPFAMSEPIFSPMGEIKYKYEVIKETFFLPK